MIKYLLALLLFAVPLQAQRTTGAGDIKVVQFSGQAIRYLQLQYEAYNDREYLGCLLGAVENDTAKVARVAPADVDKADSKPESVNWVQPCWATWRNVIGVVHNHTVGKKCSHYLTAEDGVTPTSLPGNDLVNFMEMPFQLSIIVCGDHMVFVDRTFTEHRITWPGLDELK